MQDIIWYIKLHAALILNRLRIKHYKNSCYVSIYLVFTVLSSETEWEQKTLEQEDDFCTQVITLNSFQWTWDTVFVQYIQTHLILWLNQ